MILVLIRIIFGVYSHTYPLWSFSKCSFSLRLMLTAAKTFVEMTYSGLSFSFISVLAKSKYSLEYPLDFIFGITLVCAPVDIFLLSNLKLAYAHLKIYPWFFTILHKHKSSAYRIPWIAANTNYNIQIYDRRINLT